MTAIACSMPTLSTLLRLGRVSNLPTVWTDVIAATAIAGGHHFHALGLIIPAMTAFYVGGMYINDFFDRAIDVRERPGRPIAAGEISVGTVAGIGFALLALGILLMAPFGPAAAACGGLLAAAIVAYDLWHKGNPLSPVVMGLCRALVYVGTCVAVAGKLTSLAVLGAILLACHVAGLTYAAKQEHLNRIGSLWPLLMLAVPFVAALSIGAGEWTVLLALVLLFAADTAAIDQLVRRPAPGAVGRAVLGLIAAICIVDAVAVAWAGGSAVLVVVCAAGYVLTRAAQKVVPGT